MFLGPLAMILFIAAIVALVILLVRWLSGSSARGLGAGGEGRTLEILRERYARGEIGKEEFEERRRVLGV